MNNKLFVSYSYVRRNDSSVIEIYKDFGNMVIEFPIPMCELDFENLTNHITRCAIIDTGIDNMSCTILYYKEL